MSQRQLYGSPSVLPDATIVAKILITAAKLFNACDSGAADEIVADTIDTLRFYTEELMRRHQIATAPEIRHSEYNSPFPVASLLKPIDYAALILQKAIRIHTIFHTTKKIHTDSTADLSTYITLLHNTSQK
jgi:hypothetical protein